MVGYINRRLALRINIRMLHGLERSESIPARVCVNPNTRSWCFYTREKSGEEGVPGCE